MTLTAQNFRPTGRETETTPQPLQRFGVMDQIPGGNSMKLIKAPTSDNSNSGDISEKSGPLPDLDGKDVVVEVFMYPAYDEGAFVAVQNATTLASGEMAWIESTTVRGAEAVQLGLALIAAGRRAIELDAVQ